MAKRAVQQSIGGATVSFCGNVIWNGVFKNDAAVFNDFYLVDK